jgi:ABC-2 type transport system permease protein
MRNAIIRDLKIPGYIAVSLLQEIASIAVNIIFFNVIFSNIVSLAGWSFYQVLFLYAFAKTISSLSYAFTRYGLKDFGEHMIKFGDYDFHLIKPIDTMALVSFSRPRPTKLVATIFYAVLGVYSAMKTEIIIEPINLFWFFVLAIFGLIIFYALEVLTVLPAFKLIRVWSLPEIIPKMGEFMRYPIAIFSLPFQVFLFGVFPILAVSYIPAEALFYPPEPLKIIYLMAIAGAFFIIVRKLWKFLGASYSSSSS